MAYNQSNYFFSKNCCIIKKYKTFSVLIYSYINTSGNWKNEKLCGNTTPAGRSVFTQFRVFPKNIPVSYLQFSNLFRLRSL